MPDLVTAPVRQMAALRERGHRPWPLPRRPWVLGQTWRSLLFAHWSLDPDQIAPLVPAPLDLETSEGRAWIGLTPFMLTGFRLALTPPLPYVSSFPEINVRTYVSYEGKPGIFFFSLDAGSRLAVSAARRFYRLPYFLARMTMELNARGASLNSTRTDDRGHEATFTATYRSMGKPGKAAAGSLEHFLTERYCLYAVEGRALYRAEIHHPPWSLQPAEAALDLNTMLPPGLSVPDEPPLLHFSECQDVVIWAPDRLAGRV